MSPTRKLSLALVTLLITGFALAALPRMRSAQADTLLTYTETNLAEDDGRPANDDFANAEVIAGSVGTVTGTNVDATLEAGEPKHINITFSRSVWYKWQAPAENVAVTFDTLGSNPDTVIAIYTGSSLGDLAQVANNNDVDDNNLHSSAPFHAVANTTYYIAVANYFDDPGAELVLNWSATPEPTFQQTASQRLVYEKDRQITIVNSDGTSPVNISRNTADERYPSWTTDAAKILFNSTRDGNGLDIYRMNPDGSDAQIVGPPGKAPVLSPDGAHIAYIGSGAPEGIEALYVMNADGSGQTRLTFNSGFATEPVWSPDSTKIAYRSVQSLLSEIHVISASGGGDTSIAGSGSFFEVSWSPDGSKITFTNRNAGEILIVPADGFAAPANLTNHPQGFDTNAVWSHDGSQIAFLSDRDNADGNSEVYLMNPDGSNQHRVTTDGINKRELSWSPDDLRIAYIGQPGGGSEGIYTVGPDGSFPSRLTTSEARHAHVRWEPIIAPPPPATAELMAWAVVNPLYVHAGGQLTYSFYLFNFGPAVAADATLTAQFPAGVTLDAINDDAGGSCSGTPGSASFNCTFPTFNVYETKMVRVTVTSTVTGAPYTPVPTGFTLSSTTPENNTSDNTGTINFLIAAPPLPAPTPGPAAEEQVAFMMFNPLTPKNDIFRQRVDGAELLNLTDDPADEGNFVWSHDGNRIALVRYDFPNLTVSLSVMNADGSNHQVLTNVPGEYIDEFIWSPDNNKILFNARPYGSNDAMTSDIYVINADGTNRTNLTNGDGYNTTPRWSPDGSRISYLRSQYNPDSTQTHDIYVINADGTNRIAIPHADGERDARPVWSPDGTRLAFMRNPTDGAPNLYTVRPDGTDLLRLTNDPNSHEDFPQWSPDGSKVMFSSSRSDGQTIDVVNANGSGRTAIFTPQPDGTSYSIGIEKWSPDSTKVAYQVCDGECQRAGIYIVNADGTGRYQLGEDREQNFFSDWSPDGTRLAFISNRNGVSRINIINVDGTGRVELPGQAGNYGAPKWRPRPLPNTPAGSNVTVTQGSVAVTFSNVATAGQTTVTPIDPNTVQGLPGEYVINANSLAFEITTTAAYTGPITIGFQVPGVNDPVTFSTLRVLHGEPPPVPNFVDRTILAPDSPSHNFPTRTIYARVTSLSPFIIAERASTDTTPPGIQITQPTDATYLLRQAVTVSYSCTDDGGSGLAQCNGPVASGALLNTNAVGSFSFTVNALDNAGNATTRTVNYRVAYGVNPLFDQTKANKSGSTVPIKLELVDALGANRSASNVVVTAVSVVRISDDASGALAAPGESNPDFNFRYQSGGYHFNLKTSGYGPGTYRLNFRAGNDPVLHTVQFKVK